MRKFLQISHDKTHVIQIAGISNCCLIIKICYKMAQNNPHTCIFITLTLAEVKIGVGGV